MVSLSDSGVTFNHDRIRGIPAGEPGDFLSPPYMVA
ncbi:hypothetical protein FHU35_14474 [Saccharopolyspora dendranthemae]|uniref:Uncharacterized protein n=1 Tax=Saccharopolyspora dendranthemae TaxID=1181886 RepID=A0A561U4A6_9PSEU|nr:hypothetical protein FHU35_14474 [Saccharopolyspora dendranthemae]